MKIVFRVDAPGPAEIEHAIIRCRNLAVELQRRGAKIYFICRKVSDDCVQLLAAAGFGVTKLLSYPESGETDAAQTIDALGGRVDIMVLDHSEIEEGWERAVRAGASRVVAIDDIGDRSYDVDILVDQRFSSPSAGSNQSLDSAQHRTLRGPRYALLGIEYLGGRGIAPLTQVDGLGARRVAEVLFPTSIDELRLRPARMAHMSYLFELMNVPDVRAQSFTERSITWDEHNTWLTAKLRDIDAELWVLEANLLPVGQIRIDRREGDALLSYALDPAVRGRGWGHRLVELGLAALRPHSVGRVVAEVKLGNLASRAIFDRRGFGRRVSESGDRLIYVLN